MNKTICIDSSLGSQIWRYELDDLDAAERERFEEHLMVCAACRAELTKMAPAIDAIRSNRADLLSNLETDGVSFDQISAEISGKRISPEHRMSSAAGSPSRLAEWLAVWRRPWVFAPSLAAVTAVVLMVIFWSPRQSIYLGALRFEPLLYERNAGRGNEALRGHDPFVEGMDAYCTNDFRGAESRLSKAVRRDPANMTAWLYLGVSRYMGQKPRAAIKALRRAGSSADVTIHDSAQWYLAQAFLLNNQADSALARINGLESTSRWRPDADCLVVRLKSWRVTP